LLGKVQPHSELDLLSIHSGNSVIVRDVRSVMGHSDGTRPILTCFTDSVMLSALDSVLVARRCGGCRILQRKIRREYSLLVEVVVGSAGFYNGPHMHPT
jgi:hypothetical protein